MRLAGFPNHNTPLRPDGSIDNDHPELFMYEWWEGDVEERLAEGEDVASIAQWLIDEERKEALRMQQKRATTCEDKP